MLAVVLHGMQGTPYIYQGEELGMTNVQYPIEDYEDLETLNMYHERKKQGYQEEGIMRSIHAKSRDNARTPMQWDASDNAGFTTGTPWLKVNPNYIEINAKDNLEDPDSVFACYQKLIALRKSYPVFVDGHFRLLLEEDENFFAYMREDENSELLVVANFFDQQVNLPLELDLQDYTILYQNYKDTSGNLYRPYEARIYYKQK